MQSSFFDYENRLAKLNARDALVRLNNLIDWEIFRHTLEASRQTTPRKSLAGRKPFDAVLMFKGLVLQHLYGLSDGELEYQIRDRFTFMRFMSLTPEARIPDANTFWDFREALIKADVIKTLFNDFEQHLVAQGVIAQKGQIIDASFVDAPRQRNSREENAQIKAGNVPESFQKNPAKQRQKDLDARWTKKNNETHYGYKNHVSIDKQHKIIRDYDVTDASVHDSQVCSDILATNTDADVWADSAYSSAAQEAALGEQNYISHIHEKGYRNRPLSDAQKASNKEKSKIRARVEHVFGTMTNEMGGIVVRVIGLVRATAKVGLMNLAYNLKRFETLHRIGALDN
jgi:IS5 family transposase